MVINNICIETQVLLCDFHREQAWERWTSKKDNGASDTREDLLAKLRQIAKATTQHKYNKALDMLKGK